MSDINDRYEKVETRTLPNGRIVYKSLRPKTVFVDTITDIAVDASDTTRLDKLAYNAYGSAEKWWVIAAGNGQFKGSLFYDNNVKIYIPSS